MLYAGLWSIASHLPPGTPSLLFATGRKQKIYWNSPSKLNQLNWRINYKWKQSFRCSFPPVPYLLTHMTKVTPYYQMKYKMFPDDHKQSKTLHQFKYLHHLSHKVLCASTVGNAFRAQANMDSWELHIITELHYKMVGTKLWFSVKTKFKFSGRGIYHIWVNMEAVPQPILFSS